MLGWLTYRGRQTWDRLFIEQLCEKYCVVSHIIISRNINCNLKAHHFLKTSRSPYRTFVFFQVWDLCSLAETLSYSSVQLENISHFLLKKSGENQSENKKLRNSINTKILKSFSDFFNTSRIFIKTGYEMLQNFGDLYGILCNSKVLWSAMLSRTKCWKPKSGMLGVCVAILVAFLSFIQVKKAYHPKWGFKAFNL